MTDLTNWAPYSILVGPADVYIAAVGAEFPFVDAVPNDSDWTNLGLTEGGVTVRHPQTVNPITADQHTGAVKAVRTEESLEVEFALAEITLENYSVALNATTIDTAATTSGGADAKALHYHQGVHVALNSILIRGRSPYGNWPAQYEVPVAYQSESPEVSHVKDDKSVLACVFSVLEDLSAASDEERFGRFIAQSSAS